MSSSFPQQGQMRQSVGGYGRAAYRQTGQLDFSEIEESESSLYTEPDEDPYNQRFWSQL
jgi:hypothetical protein